MAANAVVHAIAALVVVGAALPILPGAIGLCFALLTALFFGMSASWENSLWGFQSQFYLLLLFAVLHLRGSLLSRPRSWAWWLAPLAGAAGVLSMASGMLSAVAILAVVGMRALRDRRLESGDGYVLGANAALAVGGGCLRVDVPGHALLRAQSLLQGVESWLYQLAWPVVSHPWTAVLRLAPPVALGLCYWRRRLDGRAVATLLAASAWCWLQSASIAYGRGGLGHGEMSRYTDILAVGVLVNVLALVQLAAGMAEGRLRRLWRAWACIYVCAAVCGLAAENANASGEILRHLPTVNAMRVAAVRGYLATGDAAFAGREAWWELPFPANPYFVHLLDVPAIRGMLPAGVRAPRAAAEGDARQPRLSHFANEILGNWPWLLGLGAALGTAALVFALSAGRDGWSHATPIALGWRPGLALLCIGLTGAASLPFVTTAANARAYYFFEVNLTSDRRTTAQVFYDVGRGISENDSSRQWVDFVGMPRTYRLPLPVGIVKSLRFDPTDREGRMTLAYARIVDRLGGTIREFGPEDFVPVQQIAAARIQGDALHLETAPHADDPVTRVVLRGPLVLPFGWRQFIRANLPLWAIIGSVFVLAVAAFAPNPRR
jgi:hypothetical protein